MEEGAQWPLARYGGLYSGELFAGSPSSYSSATDYEAALPN